MWGREPLSLSNMTAYIHLIYKLKYVQVICLLQSQQHNEDYAKGKKQSTQRGKIIYQQKTNVSILFINKLHIYKVEML